MAASLLCWRAVWRKWWPRIFHSAKNKTHIPLFSTVDMTLGLRLWHGNLLLPLSVAGLCKIKHCNSKILVLFTQKIRQWTLVIRSESTDKLINEFFCFLLRFLDIIFQCLLFARPFIDNNIHTWIRYTYMFVSIYCTIYTLNICMNVRVFVRLSLYVALYMLSCFKRTVIYMQGTAFVRAISFFQVLYYCFVIRK
jgi:hypothetical protein